MKSIEHRFSDWEWGILPEHIIQTIEGEQFVAAAKPIKAFDTQVGEIRRRDSALCSDLLENRLG